MDDLVSVVIVNWNVKKLLADCLKSLRVEAEANPMEVIVLDNGSGDGSPEMIRTEFPEVQLIISDTNLGFAKGNNVAIKKTTGKYVFLLNPDTVVHEGCLAHLVSSLEDKPDVAMVGPKIFLPDGSIQFTCARNFPSLLAFIFQLSLLKRVFPKNRLYGRYRLEYWDHLDSREVPCLSGAAIMVRRKFFDEDGLLDEQIPMYFEDMDLCYRPQLSGYQVYYCAEAEITHFTAQSSSVSANRTSLLVLEQGEACWLFFKKHKGALYAGIYALIMLVGSVYRMFLMLFPLLISPFLGNSRRASLVGTFRKYAALFKWSLQSKKPAAILQRYPISAKRLSDLAD